MNNRIALVDWDGTIRKGFTIKEWSSFLVDNIGDVNFDIIEKIDNLFSKYSDGDITHDQLADASAHAYAKYIKNTAIEDINDLAKEFITLDIDNLFAYSKELFSLLHELEIRPIIISGCPEVILNNYKRIFYLDKIYGLKLKLSGQKYSIFNNKSQLLLIKFSATWFISS